MNTKRVGLRPTSALSLRTRNRFQFRKNKILEVIIMTKIQHLLEQLKQLSTFSYDIALGQYNLLKSTNASKQAFDDFEEDLKGAIAMFK